MATALRNVVVLGGSYVGTSAAVELSKLLPVTHRVLLVEPHSHFHHLFAFPRFAIVPSHEHKAFIPYTAVFATSPNQANHAVVQAKAISLKPHQLTLDREWRGSKDLDFDYLVVATGTRLTAPGNMSHDDKLSSVEYLKTYQDGVKKANSILVIGGGAVGVQMACDLKEVYPNKDVTLAHSREQLMPTYNEELSNIIKARFNELGVNLITGSRVIVPPSGFPTDGRPFEVKLQNGRKVATELAIVATGQTPNTEFLRDLEATSSDSVINPGNGFVRVRPTLQFQDPKYPHLFAIGDIADSGAHKAARPGVGQAAVAAKNIVALLNGQQPTEEVVVGPAGIHMTLGLKKNIVFRNPDKKAGDTEPFIKWRDDGVEDMGVNRVWQMRGITVQSPQDYHL